MSKTPMITVENETDWENWHQTSHIGGKVAKRFTPHNLWEDGTFASSRRFRPGLAGLQRIVRRARQEGRRVRAHGSSWSLSEAPYTDDFLINCARLTNWWIGVQTESMIESAAHTERKDRLVWCQTGTTIKTLNAGLENRGLSLPTSGASNGQTFVGAMSTGTHGAAHSVGSIQDYVLGLNLIDGTGKSFWVERESHPVMSEEFCDYLGAELIRDDDLFDAAVVGFGSFGVVHSVIFEAEPIYLLERHVDRVDVDEARAVASNLDVSTLDLPEGDELPFHFEMVFNPYRRRPGEKGAFLRYMYKRTHEDTEPTSPSGRVEQLRSEDLLTLVGKLSDAIPGVIPNALENQLEQSIPTTSPGGVVGTHGEIFTETSLSSRGDSTEIGVPLEAVNDALDAIFDVSDDYQFGAPVALRYIAPSDALLGLGAFEPVTCAIELPGIDSKRTREAYERIWDALRRRDIQHTYHWGQALPRRAQWVAEAYGNRRERWLEARDDFLSPAGKTTFSSDFLRELGLAG